MIREKVEVWDATFFVRRFDCVLARKTVKNAVQSSGKCDNRKIYILSM